jgi:hypothetical protein
MGKRLDDADDALRQGSQLRPGENARSSFARGDLMFYETLTRGRAWAVATLVAAAAFIGLLVVLFR